MLKLKTKIKKYTVAILIIVVFACGAINMIDQAGEFGIFLGQKYNLVNSVTGELPEYYITLPESESKNFVEIYQVQSETIREITAYNVGDVSQTDSSPCISANGENICEAVDKGYKRCAANFVPLGTDLFIENYGQYKVTDRMNSKYSNRVDIAMSLEAQERAIEFGLQRLNVRVLASL